MCTCLLQPHAAALLRVSFIVLDLASNNSVRCFLPVFVVTGKREKCFARLYWHFTRPLLFAYRTHRQGSPTRSPPADTSFSSRRGRQLPQVPVRSGSIEQGIQKEIFVQTPGVDKTSPLATPFYEMTRFGSYSAF